MFKDDEFASQNMPILQEHEQPELNLKNHYPLRKRLIISVLAIVAIAIVAAALLIPQGAASIPLTVNYTVGEKMIYNTTGFLNYAVANSLLPPGNDGLTPSNTTTSYQETMDVLSFDGTYYTLNDTMTLSMPQISSRPLSLSWLEKVNNTGYSEIILAFGENSTSIPDGLLDKPQFVQLLNQPVVKVGDSVTIPETYLGNGSSSYQLRGGLTLTFKGIQDLTVPAGTYKVFKVDVTGNTVQKMNLPLPLNGIYLPAPQPTATITTSIINEQMYFGYGSMRQIETTMQLTSDFQSSVLNYTMTQDTNTILNQEINP